MGKIIAIVILSASFAVMVVTDTIKKKKKLSESGEGAA